MPSTEDTSLKDLFSKGDLRYMYCQTGNPPSMAPPKVVRMFKDHQDRNFYRMMDFTQSLGDHTMAILSIRQHTETFPRDRLDEMPNRVTFDSCLTHQSIGDCLAAHLGPLWGASIGEVVRSVEALTEDQPLLGGQRDIPGCKGIIEGSVSETDEPKSSLSLFHIVLTIYEGMEGKVIILSEDPLPYPTDGHEDSPLIQSTGETSEELKAPETARGTLRLEGVGEEGEESEREMP